MINFGLSYMATAHICKVDGQQSLQGMSLSLPSMLILLPGWLMSVPVCPVFAVMKDPFLGFARVSPMSARLTEAAFLRIFVSSFTDVFAVPELWTQPAR